MKRALNILGLLSVWLLVFSDVPGAAEDFRVLGEELSGVRLNIPSRSEDKAYLGLRGSGGFRLGQVKADLIIVEILSMYCPFCQAAAPGVNRMFNLIQGAPRLRKRVKMVGVGMGNTDFEVGVFKRKYRVRFPIIADKEHAVAAASDEKFRTPTFIVAKKVRGNRLEVLWVHLGEIEDVAAFVKWLSSV